MLGRIETMKAIVGNRAETLFISGLGCCTYDLFAVGDHPLNFYLWGGMGSAATMGLGLALAQPKRRVVVATGDGEMLMGLGSLATIAQQKPDNLAIVVLDNERYGETGMQPTHTAAGVDLPGMAAAAGFPVTRLVKTRDELTAALPLIRERPGPVFVSVKIAAEKLPLTLPPRDGAYLKHRFREALLGAAEATK